MTPPMGVPKTYKLYLGGAFVRSESGRTSPVMAASGRRLANVPCASRKDLRDAVRAARGAFAPWSGLAAHNRGQILYRLAEAIDSRRADLAATLATSHGQSLRVAAQEVVTAVDTVLHYAGWTDKLAAILGGVNPVAAPYLSFSVPEPIGVVGVIAPPRPALLGLLTELTPVLAAGNVAVVCLSERFPLVGLDLGEILHVADIPPGVVGLMSGSTAEIAPALAAHRDLDALVDAGGDAEMSVELGRLAARSVVRFSRRDVTAYDDPARRLGLARLEAAVEIKTAWHPVGA